MGGSAAWYSTAFNMSETNKFKYKFDTAFTLAGCCDMDQNCTTIPAKQINVPTFILDGSSDCLCNVSYWAIPTYQAIPLR